MELTMKHFGRAALFLFLAVSCLAQQQVAPFKTQQINSTYYVGFGAYNSIQKATTDACKTAGATVIVPAGITPTDSPTTTAGCANVAIVDLRVTPQVSYIWVAGTGYVEQPNLAPVAGILKGNGNYNPTAAVAADIVNLFGSCTTTQVLLGSGLCGAAGTTLPSGQQYNALAYVGLGNSTSVAQINSSTDATGNQWNSPILNGIYDAYKWQSTPTSNNGIANAEAAAGANSQIVAGPNYATVEAAGFPSAAQSVLQDERLGSNSFFYHNAGANTSSNFNRGAATLNCLWDDQPLNLGGSVSHQCNTINQTYSAPGVYAGSPWSLTGSLYFSSLITGRSISQGIGGNFRNYKVGDDAGLYFYNHNRAGAVATSDEGTAGANFQNFEDPPPSGTISIGGANATLITPNFTTNNGNQGDGMALVSTSEIMSSGSLLSQVATSGTPFRITTSDAHGISTGIGVLASACGTLTTRNQPITSTCTVTITSGSFSTTATMCVGDAYPETVAVSAVGTVSTTQTVTAGFTFAHPAGTIVEQGGMCGGKLALGNGYSNPSTANSGFMTSYYVVGSPTATTLDVVNVFKGGQNGPQSVVIPGVTSPYSVSFSGMSRTSNVVTAAVNGAYPQWPNYYVAPPLASMQISGASDPSFNVTITGTTVNNNIVTWPQTAANSTATGGTLNLVGLNNYVVYCGAETVQVLPTQLQVEPNNCAWPVGGTIDQPNFYAQSDGVLGVSGNGTTPDYDGASGLALSLAGHKYAGSQYALILSTDPLTNYVGYGGTDNPQTLIATNPQNQPHLGAWISLPAPMAQGILFNVGRIPYDSTHTPATTSYKIFQIMNRDNSTYTAKYDEVSKIMTFDNLGANFTYGTIGGVGSNVNIANITPNLTGQGLLWNLTGDNEVLQRNAANTGLAVHANAGDKFTVFDSALGQSVGATGYLGKIDATTTVGTGSSLICQSNGTNCPTYPFTISTGPTTSDSITVPNVVAGSHCWFSASNASASTSTGNWISWTTSTVTLTHAATAGMQFTGACSIN